MSALRLELVENVSERLVTRDLPSWRRSDWERMDIADIFSEIVLEGSRYKLNRVRVSTFLDVLDEGRTGFKSRFGNGIGSNEEGGGIAGENLLKDHPRHYRNPGDE